LILFLHFCTFDFGQLQENVKHFENHKSTNKHLGTDTVEILLECYNKTYIQ